MQRETFRKTVAGHAELRDRARGLDARTRTLLILANGELSVEELGARVGFQPLPVLLALAADGLLEPVTLPSRAKTPVRPAPPPPPPAPSSPPAAAPTPDASLQALLPADLAAARTRALTALTPHYGPDALRMAAPLRTAPTPQEFAAALSTLRETLAVHMGRKRAEQLVRQIVQGA